MSLRAGFTLVEVIVALLLLEILLFGALLSMHLGAHRTNRALVLEQAVWAASALVDSIAYRNADASARRDHPWGWLDTPSGRVEARDSTGRLLVSLEVAP